MSPDSSDRPARVAFSAEPADRETATLAVRAQMEQAARIVDEIEKTARITPDDLRLQVSM